MSRRRSSPPAGVMLHWDLVDPDSWPSGENRPIAVLSVPRDALESQGIKFSRLEDDLGEAEVAAVRLSTGTVVGLGRHFDSPTSGMMVYSEPDADPSGVLAEVLKALSLSEDTVTWRLDG